MKPAPPIRPNPRLANRIDKGGGWQMAVGVALIAIAGGAVGLVALLGR